MADVFTYHMPASDVFAIEPHFDEVGDAVAFQSKVVRGAGVVGQIDPTIPMDRRTINTTYRLLSWDAQKEIFDRIQELWYGGVSCYVPTWNNDFDVTANGGSTLTVKHNGFDVQYNQICSYRVKSPWLYTSYGLLVVTRDGVKHFFKLGSSSTTIPPLTGPVEPFAYVNNGDGTATLNLKVTGAEALAFGAYSVNDIVLCSLIVRCRKNSSSIDLDVKSTSIVDTKITWTEVFFESPFLPPAGSSGFVIPIKDGAGNVRGYWAMTAGNKMAISSGAPPSTYFVALNGGAPPTGKMTVTLDSGTFAVALTAI